MKGLNKISSLSLLFLSFLMQTEYTIAAPAAIDSPENGQLLLEKVIQIFNDTTLNYNQRCSFQNEQQKTALGLKLLDTIAEKDLDKFRPIAIELIQLANSSGPFCTTTNNLQCSSDGICECGNGESLAIPLKSIRENNECVLAVDSICSAVAFPNFANLGTSLKCQQNSECLVKNSTTPCTTMKLREILEHGFGGLSSVRKNPIGFQKYVREMSLKEICVCKASSSS